jgi:Leucine-rich repeat (LRR) protein
MQSSDRMLRLYYISSLESILPAGNLINGKIRNLESLSLASCSINALKENIFSNLKHLKYLNLNSNSVTQIRDLHLNGLDRLEILDLGSNRIKQIDENSFQSFAKSLLFLNIGDNRVQTFKRGIFKNMFNLKYLDMSEAKDFTDWLTFSLYIDEKSVIEPFDSEIFSDLINLKQLKLLRLQERIIATNMFKNQINLKILSINVMHIDKIDEYLSNDLESLERIELLIPKSFSFDFKILIRFLNLKQLIVDEATFKKIKPEKIKKILPAIHIFKLDEKKRVIF